MGVKCSTRRATSNRFDSPAPEANGNRDDHIKQRTDSLGKFPPPGDLILERVKEFGQEMQGLQVTTVNDDETTEELIADIIEHEKKYFGIDLKKALESDEARETEVKKLYDILREIRKSMSNTEVTIAKSMGLLDSKGEVNKYDVLSKSENSSLTPMPPDAVPFTIWGWRISDADIFRESTNGQVKHNICRLIRKFQLMKTNDTKLMVAQFIKAGIWGLGLHGVKAVWNILGMLPNVTDDAVAYAVLEGIKAVGESVVNFAVRATMLAILGSFFTQKHGNAATVMVILNDSNEDMELADIFMEHGKVVGIFKEQLCSENPQPIIPKRMPPIVNVKTGKTIVKGSIHACFFATRKRDQAQTGCQGVLKFEPTGRFPVGIFVKWEVPLAERKNRVVVSADYNESLLNFSNFANSQSTDLLTSHSSSSKEGKVTGLVDSNQGAPAYYIISINSPLERLVMSPKEPSLEEKAAELSKKLKSITIPDVANGKTLSQLMDDVLNHEKEQHGIDWRAAVQEGDRAVHNAIYKAHNRLHKIAKQMNTNEVKRAKEMNLLDSNGDVKILDLLGNEGEANPNLASIPSGATAFPCLGWTLEQAARFQNAEGDEIKRIIFKIIRAFQMAENCDEGSLSHLFMDVGLLGIGVEVVYAVWEFLKVLDTATSMALAIAEFGIKAIQYAMSVFVLGILVPIVVHAKQDAAGVFIVMNDTFEDMKLEALAVTHAIITGIFKENRNKNERLAIIPKRQKPVYKENSVKMNDGAVFAGFMVMRKKDSALHGPNGALKFSASTDYPNGVFAGWEVPIGEEHSRLLVSADFIGGVEAWSNKTKDEGKQEDKSQSSTQAEITGRVNSGSGCPAYYVINIGAADSSSVQLSPVKEISGEKKKQFWNEIRDLRLPDYTSGKTSDQVISDILQHEKLHHEIDWEAAAKGGEKEIGIAMKKSHERLNEIRKKMGSNEVERAKSMGLLDSNGMVPLYDALGDGSTVTTAATNDAVPYTIWCWKAESAVAYQTATGERIKDLIINLIRNFQVMGEDDERMMTKMFLDTGLWALGRCGLLKVVEILKASSCLNKATEAFAVVSGIKEVGINVIKLGIATMIVAILVPLFTYPSKDACAVFVIVNDTDDDLDLIEWHTKYGKVVGIFKENPNADNPKAIIPRRIKPIINPETGVEICKGSVQAGFFAAKANNNTLDGTQGALKFRAMTSFSKGIFMGWEVPMSDSDNRLLVSADFSGSTSQFSDRINEEDKQEDTSNGSNDAKVEGRVHSANGSAGYYLFNVTEPTKEAPTGESSLPQLHSRNYESKNTNEELLNEVFDHEKKVNGIDWKAATKKGKEAIHEATRKARDQMQSMADKMTKEELGHAKAMGLVDSDGKVPEFDLLAEGEHPAMFEAALATSPTVPIPSTASPYMVWGWKPSKAKEYEDSAGGDIKTKLLNLVRAFQALKKDNREQMANGFMKMGIWGVGLVGLRATWNALSAAAAISDAVEVAAIAEGIAAIGVSVVTLAIAACILAVLVPIFIFMSKNAAAIMVIINDTDEDIRMIDLHATHGKVVGIFKEKAELDNPQPILPKRLPPIINPKTKKIAVEGSVQAGFFAARKRDNALVGTQGGMKFEATKRYPQGIYIGWEVPLSFTSNRLLVSATFTGSASEFSNETNDHGEQEDSSRSSEGAIVSGRVNSGSGSEAYYIFSIK